MQVLNLGGTMPLEVSLPPMMLLGPFIAAVVVYLILRWGFWEPGKGTSAISAARHALWVGIIGWMASSLQGAMTAGIIPPGSSAGSGLATSGSILAALSWPVLGCLTVHALGQVSYPGHKGLRRRASLSLRRIRDFLPRRLACVSLSIFIFAAGCIVWASTLSGYPALPPAMTSDGTLTRSGRPGRIAGLELAACLGGALLVLAIGALLVLLLITRRRELEGLSLEENGRLRSIAMNRLLRTVATVAAGLAAIAGNFALQLPPTKSLPSFVINYPGILNLAVLLVMWAWRPPRLASAEQEEERAAAARPGHAISPRHPAGRLVASVGAVLGLAAALPLIPGILLSTVSASARDSVPALFGPAGYVGFTAALVLLVIAAGEFLLRRNYCTSDTPKEQPAQAVSPALATTAVLACVVFLCILGATYGEIQLKDKSSWITTGVLAVFVVAAAAAALLLARTRPGIVKAPPGLDAALRAVTYFRIVRTLAAFFAAQAGVLLLTQDSALAVSLGWGPDAFPAHWWLIPGTGAFLAAAGVLIAVIPVRSFARPSPGRLTSTEMDSVP